MSILVTGGAGYIGAHVVRLLQERSDEIVIVDDLVTGVAARTPGTDIIRMDLASSVVDRLTQIMHDHDVRSVIHFAARKQVAESVARPAWYFQQNIGALANVLIAMESAGVNELVFSSSAAVYGRTEGSRIKESEATIPVNPYGETKLVGEHLVEAASRSTGLRAASLRYFNVAGAGWPELGDSAILNLVPMVFERLDSGLQPIIFGDDYATEDGTCIRDYIHVMDLADAHLVALDSLRRAQATHEIYNVGTGVGTSVREMVAMIQEISGSDIAPEVRPRRDGDPARVVASPDRIQAQLGWKARRDLREIVSSAWASRRYLLEDGLAAGSKQP